MKSQQNIKFYKLFKHSFILLLCIVSILFTNNTFAQNSKFKVVLDAGHGGKDSGTVGLKSFKNVYEKDIALKVVLKIGKLLKKNKGIKTIYTRNKNNFVELHKRGKIANKEDADLFISIHCNAASTRAYGASTYVLGMGTTAKNLELAKLENDVMLQEENHEKNYNYDPNSQEFLIGLSLMQEDYLDQSIEFARIVQRKIKTVAKRKDRGVHQANFVVLYGSYMPSVLIEIGFLTNKNEERFLHSNTGQNKIAESIYKAILTYKKRIEKNSIIEVVSTDASVIKTNTSTTNSPVNTNSIATNYYKIQIATSLKKIEEKSYNFKGLPSIERVKVGKVYKYFYGVTSSINEAKKLRLKAVSKGYTDAFITKFKYDNKNSSVYKLKYQNPTKKKAPKKKVTKKKATKKVKTVAGVIYKIQIATSPKKINTKSYNFKGLKNISRLKIGRLYNYYSNNTTSYSSIKTKLKIARKKYKDAFIAPFKNGKRITIAESLK